MPDKVVLREVTSFGKVVWICLSIILGAALTHEAGVNVQGWWFEVTVLFAILLGELFTVLYDKWASESRGEIWVPLEFIVFIVVVLCVFIVVVLGGAWVGAKVTALTASTFNSLTVVAYIAFFFLNFGTSFFLYMDFLHHAHFCIWGKGPQVNKALL
jgi:hypothetical protein